MLEIERLLNDSLIENDQLCKLENTALARVQEAESQHKSVKARLHKAESQVVEVSAKLEREYNRSAELRSKIDKLRAELAEAQSGAQNAENAAQAYYDQGFEEAAASLKSQLARECNIQFLKGWVSALEQASVDDNSKLYPLGRQYQPFQLDTPENLEEGVAEGLKDPEVVEDLRHEEQIQTGEAQGVEGDISYKEDDVNVNG